MNDQEMKETRRELFRGNRQAIILRLSEIDMTIETLNDILKSKNRQEINTYKNYIILIFNLFYIIEYFYDSETYTNLNNILNIQDKDIELIQNLFEISIIHRLFENLYIENGLTINSAILHYDIHYWWNPSYGAKELYLSEFWEEVIPETVLSLVNITSYDLYDESSEDEEIEDEYDEELVDLEEENDEELVDLEEDDEELSEIEIDEKPMENGTCFDFTMYDSINILEYLQDSGTFLFINKGSETLVENFEILCFSYDDLNRIYRDKSNWFYECIGKLNYNYTQTIYLKIPIDRSGMNGFVPLNKIRKVLEKNYRIYYIVPSESEPGIQKMVNYSITWQNAYGPENRRNYVSANHCQEGSNILIFDIKVCKNPENCIISLFYVE